MSPADPATAEPDVSRRRYISGLAAFGAVGSIGSSRLDAPPGPSGDDRPRQPHRVAGGRRGSAGRPAASDAGPFDAESAPLLDEHGHDRPSVTFDDQPSDGDGVVVGEVTTPGGGFVTLTDRVYVGNVFGHTAYLQPGRHEDVSVEYTAGPRAGRIAAVLHEDTNDNEVYDFVESEGEDDTPLEVDGEYVFDTACITLES